MGLSVMALNAGGTTATGIDKVIESAGKVLQFAGTMLNTIVDNPILLFVFASSLVPIGFAVLRGLKNTASA